MLGIIIAVICSNWVGDWILSEGVYETDLERDGSVVFLRPSPPLQLYTKSSQDIMAAPVWYVVTPRPSYCRGPAAVNLYHLAKTSMTTVLDLMFLILSLPFFGFWGPRRICGLQTKSTGLQQNGETYSYATYLKISIDKV